MSDKKAVLLSLSKLNVPHLVKAFKTATDPSNKKAHKNWIDVDEMKAIESAASPTGVQKISTTDWQAILEIEKYDKIGPKAKTYLADMKKRRNAAKTTKIVGGFAVSLAHAAKFNGKRLGEGKLQGECATGVQWVFAMARKPLGLTRTWKQGVQVKGNKVPAGTAIASFRNGKFANDHAAIFIKETKSGLEVWDQYNTPQKPWGKRTLYFKNNTTDYSNNGNLFYVVTK